MQLQDVKQGQFKLAVCLPWKILEWWVNKTAWIL